MKLKIKIKTRFIVVLVLIWSITLLFALVDAESTPEIKSGRIIIDEPSQDGSFFVTANTNVSKDEVKSSILRTDFVFNAMYAKWETEDENFKNESDFNIYVRFLNENWSDWYQVLFDDDYDGKDNGVKEISSQLISTKPTDTFMYKIEFNDPDRKEALENLEFIYLDTTKGPKSDIKLNSNNDGLNIISRAQWGANESYKYDGDNNDLWEEEYYQPKKFILHHTAGEKANVDPRATVRAIQYWHSVGREWGDIGYNYLIDSQGNVYEGRKGGDGVVGGHAFMKNRNSIGIAILGCYQTGNNGYENSTCNTPDKLTQATKNSLNRLIAVKSREFNIDPLGQSEFNGDLLPNVIGHRDVGNTVCPGTLVMDLLPQTRTLAYNVMQELGGYKKPLPSSAQFVNQSATEITIEETKTASIYVQFKNTGQAVWRGYEDSGLYVADSDVKNRLTQIGSVSLASYKNNTAKNLVRYRLIGGNVYPGEIGRFELVLSPPSQTKTEVSNFTLAWQKKGYFPNSDFSVKVNKIACSSCNQNKTTTQVSEIYGVSLSQSTILEQMSATSESEVMIVLQNTGNKSLSKDKLRLKINYADDLISPFRNNSWYSEQAMIPPLEELIYPNNVATFKFRLKAPDAVYDFPHTIRVLYDNRELYRFEKNITVVSAYASQLVENNIPVALLASWRPTIKMTFQNTGTKVWDKPILKSYDIDYTNSWFRDWSWHDNKTIEKTWTDIEPGESITFEFKITPYWKRNTYPHVYKLFDGDEEIKINGKDEFLTYTRVD